MYTNTLTNWSYKKLKMYRACPFSVYLKYIKREPEPAPDPKYDAKRQRGIVAHDELAECINNGAAIPPIATAFESVIVNYIELGAVAEIDEYLDNRWQPLPDHKGHWLIVKKDILVRKPGEFSLVADWKTGKKFGNELDHFEQMKLYSASEFMLDPGYPEYAVELQYLDQNDTWAHSFKPHEMEKIVGDFEKDVAVMMNDTLFRPKPNIYTCRYCPFNKSKGTGVCPVAAL